MSSFSEKLFVIPKMFCLEYIHCIVSAQKVRCVILVLDAYIMHFLNYSNEEEHLKLWY